MRAKFKRVKWLVVKLHAARQSAFLQRDARQETNPGAVQVIVGEIGEAVVLALVEGSVGVLRVLADLAVGVVQVDQAAQAVQVAAVRAVAVLVARGAVVAVDEAASAREQQAGTC